MPADPIPALDPAGLAELEQLLRHFDEARHTSLGFPAATDIDYTLLAPFLGYLLNNLGDPMTDGAYPHHTKAAEREVLTVLADLLRAPTDDRWGYVASGATEGTEHALDLAYQHCPGALVYHSERVHHATTGAIRRLRLPAVTIRAGDTDEIDYHDLAAQLDQHRHRPAIVVANAGTALSEAVDNIALIDAILDQLAVRQRWIHVDAALSGIPLATLNPTDRPPFDFADGATSIIVSGHKFLGTPLPCAVFLVRDSHRPYPTRSATYTGSPDTTLTNSRSGLAVLCLWYALRRLGTNGLRTRAERSRQLAAYTQQRLTEIGWHNHRHPHAFTVTLDTPPPHLTTRWALAGDQSTCHLICMPGITRQHIDAFIDDLRTLRDHPPDHPPATVVVPHRQHHRPPRQHQPATNA